ncbi:MAG: hemolysin family protein [Candidatus Margulisiibacteriota bacterium]
MSFDFFILFLLLLGSAFFSGAETSITTIGKAKLKNLIENGNKAAISLDKLHQKPGKLLATILVGNNLVNIAFSVIATTIMLELLHSKNFYGIISPTLFITLLLTFIILVFGELIPKMLALSKAERFALAVARPISILQKLLAPVVIVINGFARFLVHMVGIKVFEKGTFVTEEELKTLIDIGREEGVLEEEERQMLASVFDLSETIVREIMTPRTDMVCVDIKTGLSEIISLFSQKGHSRIPVYEEKRDNIIGIIYAKDLIRVTQGAEINVRSLLRPVQFVPETKKIDELLKKMRTRRIHIAIVIDEHGGVAGLVTIEDILEEIVGEITDEYDEIEEPSLQKIENNTYLVDAGMNVYEFNQKLNTNIPEDDDYDTIGGFVFNELGEIPKVGEKINYENLVFEVTQVKKQRILQIKLTVEDKVKNGLNGKAAAE